MSKAAMPGSPGLRKLIREHLRPEYSLKPAGKGFAIVNEQGEEIRWPETGMPYRLPNTPSTNLSDVRDQLHSLGVLLDGSEKAPRAKTSDENLVAEQSSRRALAQAKQERSNRLREQLAVPFRRAGGLEMVRTHDFARVLTWLSPQTLTNLNSTTTQARNWLRGQTPQEPILDALDLLLARLEAAEDPKVEWFDLLRESFGFQPLKLREGEEWPFRMELVPLGAMFADESYQRPPDANFVRQMVLGYDERLVGTLDLSQRPDGRFAIMDGLQRFMATGEVGKTSIWGSIYEGLSIAEEARFFFDKNAKRKHIHPYYHFRARLVAGDEQMIRMNRIVEGAGYKLQIGGTPDDALTSIAGVEDVFGYSSEHRIDCLTPTLSLMRRLFYGRKDGKSGMLIRGLGRFYRTYSDQEIQKDHFEELVGGLGPSLIIGRARDLVAQGSGGGPNSMQANIAKVLVGVHNTGLRGSDRLDISRLTWAAKR